MSVQLNILISFLIILSYYHNRSIFIFQDVRDTHYKIFRSLKKLTSFYSICYLEITISNLLSNHGLIQFYYV